jgi:hypothetical protein
MVTLLIVAFAASLLGLLAVLPVVGRWAGGY